uniref:CENP-V/GFA domain-containing protein n=1 Tax=Loa loa TaxID=7209 RepID=A0A1I7VZ83_LOALO
MSPRCTCNKCATVFFFKKAQTEQTELLDLPVSKVTEEGNVPIDLPMQRVSGEIGGWWLLVNEGSKRYRKLMNLTVKDEIMNEKASEKGTNKVCKEEK